MSEAKTYKFNYHDDPELGIAVHDGCGGPIIFSMYRIYCLKCRPDLVELGNDLRWILRWLRDNELERYIFEDQPRTDL